MKKLLFIIACFILPTVAFASVDMNLKYGTSHTQVKELQEFLIGKGFLTGDATGNFFTLTRKAVIAYQGSVGLPTTGYVGPMTREKINAELLQADTTSNTAEITETGKVTSPVNTKNDSLSSLQNQINALLAQLKELNAQAKIQTTTQQQTQITTQQIQQNTVPKPVTVTPVTPPVTPQPETLSISLGTVTTNTTSVHIAWSTNIPSNSKVFLTLDNGSVQVISSASGYSTQHFVDVSNLKSDMEYSYTIEAINGTQVKKVTNTVKTKWEDPYSDYIFSNTSPAVGEESQWRIMFSIPTPVNRDIRVKKAVFKVTDEDSVKLDAIAVGNGGAVSAGIGPTFAFGLYVRNSVLYYPVERIDKNTYVYEAINGSSGISLNWKEFPLFLSLYSYSPTIYNENKTLMANIQVPMSEWVIMDQSNGKQVKTW